MFKVEQLISCCRAVLPDRLKNINIQNETKFVEDLGLDSLALVALSLELEYVLSVSLVDRADEMMQLATVGDVFNYIQSEVLGV